MITLAATHACTQPKAVLEASDRETDRAMLYLCRGSGTGSSGNFRLCNELAIENNALLNTSKTKRTLNPGPASFLQTISLSSLKTGLPNAGNCTPRTMTSLQMKPCCCAAPHLRNRRSESQQLNDLHLSPMHPLHLSRLNVTHQLYNSRACSMKLVRGTKRN